MGSDHHYPEERPVHRVAVDGFWMDRHPVTNADFTRFVRETGHVTAAEIPPDPKHYPGAKPDMLYAGSLVFTKPAGPVDRRDFANWWQYMRGACCDTSLRGETLIDTWTLFGSSAGLRGYLRYFRYPQVNRIFAQAGYLRITGVFLRCLPEVFRVIIRSRSLSAKWPWQDYRRYLDRPLLEIRREFNIRLV